MLGVGGLERTRADNGEQMFCRVRVGRSEVQNTTAAAVDRILSGAVGTSPPLLFWDDNEASADFHIECLTKSSGVESSLGFVNMQLQPDLCTGGRTVRFVRLLTHRGGVAGQGGCVVGADGLPKDCPHGWIAVTCLFFRSRQDLVDAVVEEVAATVGVGALASSASATVVPNPAVATIGTFTIILRQARNLVNRRGLNRKVGSVDPFVSIRYRGQHYKTPVCIGCGVWDAPFNEFEFSVVDVVDEIDIRIYDWNVYGDNIDNNDARYDLIGASSFSIIDVLGSCQSNQGGTMNLEHWVRVYRTGRQSILHHTGDLSCRSSFRPVSRAIDHMASTIVTTLKIELDQVRGLAVERYKQSELLVAKISLEQTGLEKQRYVSSAVAPERDADGLTVTWNTKVTFVVTQYTATVRVVLYSTSLSDSQRSNELVDAVIIPVSQLMDLEKSSFWYPLSPCDGRRRQPPVPAEPHHLVRDSRDREGLVFGEEEQLESTSRTEHFDANEHRHGAFLFRSALVTTVAKTAKPANKNAGQDSSAANDIVGLLSVAVIRCQGLSQLARVGEGAKWQDPQPFCIIIVDNDESTTTTLNGRNPEWKTPKWYHFKCKTLSTSMSVKVFSRGILGHTLLGSVSLGLRELTQTIGLDAELPSPHNTDVQRWLTIFGTNRSNELIPKGQLQLAVQLQMPQPDRTTSTGLLQAMKSSRLLSQILPTVPANNIGILAAGGKCVLCVRVRIARLSNAFATAVSFVPSCFYGTFLLQPSN